MNIPTSASFRLTGAPAAAAPALSAPAWLPELAGLPALSAASPGELGQCLSDADRKGLQGVLDRLEARGVRFLLPRSGIFSKDHAPVPARRLLAALAEARPHYLDGLRIEAPGHAPLESATLGDLAAAGQFLLGPDDLLKRALAGLGTQGFAADPLAAYTDMMGSGNLTIQFRRGGDLETYCPRSVDETLAVNALAGDGSVQGVADPDRVRRLATAVEQGWLNRPGAVTAYRDGGRIPLTVERGLPPLKVREEALDDPAATAAQAKRYLDAWSRYVLPPLQRQGYGTSYAFHDEVHSPDGRASLEARLESLGILLAASDNPGGAALQELHKELLGRYPGSLDLVSAAKRLAPLMRDQGPEKALASLDSLGKVAPNPRNALYEELVASTGSHTAAREGVDLVRIPVVQLPPDGPPAQETQETRTRVFQDLAAALPEAERGLAPEIYQQLLINRPAEAPLAQAGDTLRSLVVACSSVGFPLLAPALYEALKPLPPDQVPVRVAAFGKALAAGARLDMALETLDCPESLEIRIEADSLTIGGVVIPRR